MPEFQLKVFSELSLLVRFCGESLEYNHHWVCMLDEFCRDNFPGWLVNRVPAYESLLLTGNNPGYLQEAARRISFFLNNHQPAIDEKPKRVIEIPVCYDEKLGNDLPAMSALLGIPANEIVASHVSKPYLVYMLGFLPGFAYMGEVDPSISVPRKPKPVPAKQGAVGIAGRQTGIYPFNSPGGWNITGYTPLKMFDPQRPTPALVTPGSWVQFVPIDFQTFLQLQQQANGGN